MDRYTLFSLGHVVVVIVVVCFVWYFTTLLVKQSLLVFVFTDVI